MWTTLKALLRRQRFESDLHEEFQHHIEAYAADLQRQGLTPTEALRKAQRELGATERYKEECRHARGLQWLDELRADLLYALRSLRRHKSFAAVAILTLTLGLGANTAVFSLVNAVMLKQLPVAQPEQLRLIYWTGPNSQRESAYARTVSGSSYNDGGLRVSDMFSYPHFLQLRADFATKADLIGWSNLSRISVHVSGAGPPASANLASATLTSGNYFSALGISPSLGRAFLPEDETPGAPLVALLNFEYWTRAFQSDRQVLGRGLTILGRPVTIVGVLPPGFHGFHPGRTFDLALPLPAWDAIAPKPRTRDARAWWVQMALRLPAAGQGANTGTSTNTKNLANLEPLRAELEAKLLHHLRAQPIAEPYTEPKIRLENGARGVHWLRTDLKQPLELISAVALLILLMAATNVAGLLLAKGEARATETSARLALGAGRGRLLRQHLTESLVLGLLGTLGGLVLAASLAGGLPALFSERGIAPVLDLAPDWRFFTADALACLMVTLLVGLYPAWRASRTDLLSTLKRSRSSRLPLGRSLAALQVGLSLVLLIAAAMFLRTISNLRALPLGFQIERRLVFTVDASLAGYQGEQLLRFYTRLQERLAALPGARSAAFSRYGVLQGGSSQTHLFYRDAQGQLRRFEGEGYLHTVSPGYFAAMDLPLLAGRDVTARDTATSQKVLLVNRAFARQLRPGGGSVIGYTVYPDEDAKQPMQVIGLVADAKYEGLRQAAPPTFYLPFNQRNQRQAAFVVTTKGEPKTLSTAVRAAVNELDPRVPIYDVRTQEEQFALAMERERSLAQILTAFGLLALLLALVGLYGTLAYSVARRTPEIGIRIALGATPATLRRKILGESLAPVLAGLGAGLAVTWWFSQLMTNLLFGVPPLDPVSIGAATLILIAGAAVAAWLPAHRASRVSPTTALRYE